MKIFVDGDGSPVKETVIEVAVEKASDVVIVTSVGRCSLKDYPENVSFVYAGRGADAADFKIVQLIEKGDLLITQDYDLASLALPKGVLVLHQLGYQYTKGNIDGLLEQRYFSGQVRREGSRTKGPKPFTDQGRTTFKQTLIELVRRSLQQGKGEQKIFPSLSLLLL